MNNHLVHLQKNKQNLEFKFAVLKLIREFFWQENFIEIEAPLIVKLPGQEPNLSPMKLTIHNERKQEFFSYLHTSPEYTMKKMLAMGWEKIFYLGKCFRDQESFGGLHNPEFTMLEFYRTEADMFKLMEDIESLFNYIKQKLQITNYKFQKITMGDLWSKYVGVNLDDYLETAEMFKLSEKLGFNPAEGETYEELFYRIFLNKIEANLIEPTIVYHYPAQMAALARLSKQDLRYAERFEVYINGIELANAFSELTNSAEQLKRLQEEREERKKMGKNIYEVDLEFTEALKSMPKSAGMALGVDRLTQVLIDCQNINDVITLPMSKIF